MFNFQDIIILTLDQIKSLQYKQMISFALLWKACAMTTFLIDQLLVVGVFCEEYERLQ